LARPKGSKNEGHAERRAALAGRIADLFLSPTPPTESMRALAQACEVSVPTLRHYFGDFDGALAAGWARFNQRGADHQAAARIADGAGLEASVAGFVAHLLEGWRFGLGHAMRNGMRLSLGQEQRGAAFLDGLVEPMVLALEARLRDHQERGDMRPGNARFAALQLLGPLVLALLHQDELDGTRYRPLEMDAFVADTVQHFVHAWAPDMR